MRRKKNCVTPAYVPVKYCEKRVKTYAVNLGFLTSSNFFSFYIYKSFYKRNSDQHDGLIFLHLYSPRKSPHNHWTITLQPLDHNPTMIRSATLPSVT